VPRAIVVLRPGATATEADILGFARDNLAHFKAPKGVDFIDGLPKTATGKTQKFALRHGRLGRSWGCPALDPSVNRDVIDAIRDRTALFAYYPDAQWLASSQFLRCEAEPVVARVER